MQRAGTSDVCIFNTLSRWRKSAVSGLLYALMTHIQYVGSSRKRIKLPQVPENRKAIQPWRTLLAQELEDKYYERNRTRCSWMKQMRRTAEEASVYPRPAGQRRQIVSP